MEESSSSSSSSDILENMRSIHRQVISFKDSVLQECSRKPSKEFKAYTKKETEKLNALLDDLHKTGKELSSDLSLNSEEDKIYKGLFQQCNEALAEIMKICN